MSSYTHQIFYFGGAAVGAELKFRGLLLLRTALYKNN